MFVSDLRHFLDIPESAPGPARTMAAQLFGLVRAATAGEPGVAWMSALTCRRRPGNRICRGYQVVFRPEGPGPIEWRCERCGDDGVISGWEDSPFDLSSVATPMDDAGLAPSFVVGDEVASALRDLQLIDSECERLVYRMRGSPDGAVLTATAQDLDELLGFVAAEANHEDDRRRRKRLGDAFVVLQGALDTIPHDEPRSSTAVSPVWPAGRWRIVETDLWDRDALDLVEPAFIDFASEGVGEFRFIAVRGWMDWRLEDSARVEFSWEGTDEGDQVNGRGWAVADGSESLSGRIYFHRGDDSGFRAVRSLGVVRP